jgi:hypothetical protein
MRKEDDGLAVAVGKLARLLWEVVYYYCWIAPGFHRWSRKPRCNDPKVLTEYKIILTGLREGKVDRPAQKVSDILVALYSKRLTLGALGTTVAELRTFAPEYVDQASMGPRSARWLKDD